MRITKIIEKIIKIIQYIPILWRDEDWDYEYLLDLISFKLNKMKKCLIKNNIVEHNQLRAMIISINQCLDHIENYQDPTVSKFTKLYGECPVKITFGQELTEEENELCHEYFLKHHNFEQDEWNKIWDTIKEHGQSWWD